MEIITAERVIVIVAFLLLLGMTLFIARMGKGLPVLRRSQKIRNLTLVETLTLAPDCRGYVVKVAGQSHLVVTTKKGGVAIQAIYGAQADQDVDE